MELVIRATAPLDVVALTELVAQARAIASANGGQPDEIICFTTPATIELRIPTEATDAR